MSVVEGVYYFGDHVRWNLWFPNPNPAGAFLAMVLPWLWLMYLAFRQRFRPWHPALLPVLLVEVATFFTLCKTYSRGALAALGAAGLVAVTWWLWRSWRERCRSWWLALGVSVARLAAAAVILLGTGFFDRVAPSYVSQDRSTLNRFVLWKGGAQMVAASPLRGWGEGKSGEHFMHWYQPSDRDEAYAGMVNSYLHIGVERGLPAVLLAVFLILTFTLAGLAADPRLDGSRADSSAWRRCFGWGALGGSLSLTAFLVANVFSTLWIFQGLWWLPSLAVIAVFVGLYCQGLFGWRFLRQSAAAAGLIALAGGAAVIFCGRFWGSPDVLIERHTGGVWLEKGVNDIEERGATLVLLPDPAVLGEVYGKAIRRLVASAPGGFRVFVAEGSEVPPDVLSEAETLVGFGARCDEIFNAGAPVGFPGRALLVHPVGRVDPPNLPAWVGVVLPSVGSGSALRRWRRLARQQGWELAVVPGVATNILPAWPDAFWKFWSENGLGETPGGSTGGGVRTPEG